MSTLRSSIRAFVGSVAAVLLSLSTYAADISGKYGDKGVQIITDANKESPEASLHGLFNLRFDPSARIDFADSTSVEISQTEDAFAVRIFDAENKPRWNGEWKKGQEYTPEGKRAAVRLRGPGSSDIYALIFEPVGDRILQVEVVRVKTSPLGPVTEPAGNYVFTRE